MALNKDQQLRRVGEGLAVGVLANGVEGLTGNKSTLQIALGRAWRRWARAGEFPALKGFVAVVGEMIYREMAKPGERKQVCARWEILTGRVRPYLLDDEWSVQDGLELIAGRSDGQAGEDWVALGALVIAELGDGHVYRSEGSATAD